MEYCNENIKDVYHELFEEALARYNEKQTRSDRLIDDYYEKTCSGKQERQKEVAELVLHCGNNGEFSICLLRQCCVVISQRCHRIASFFRLALTQKSGAEIHRYFRNAVLALCQV